MVVKKPGPPKHVREKGECSCKIIGDCFHGGCVIDKWIGNRVMLLNQKGYIALFDPDQIENDKRV